MHPLFFHAEQQYVILFSFFLFFSLEFIVVNFKGEDCFVLFLFILSKWKVLITAF